MASSTPSPTEGGPPSASLYHGGGRPSGLKLSFCSEPANKAAGPTVSGVLSGAANQSPSEPPNDPSAGPGFTRQRLSGSACCGALAFAEPRQ